MFMLIFIIEFSETFADETEKIEVNCKPSLRNETLLLFSCDKNACLFVFLRKTFMQSRMKLASFESPFFAIVLHGHRKFESEAWCDVSLNSCLLNPLKGKACRNNSNGFCKMEGRKRRITVIDTIDFLKKLSFIAQLILYVLIFVFCVLLAFLTISFCILQKE